MWKESLLAILGFVSLSSLATADVIFLKGGQKLEGEVGDKGANYEVKTEFGTLTISKAEVEKYVKSVKAIEAEAEELHRKARAFYDEALKIQNDPKASNAKLKSGVDLLRQIVQLYSDARETYSGDKYAFLDDAPITIIQEMRLYRDKMSSELADSSGSSLASKIAEKAKPAPINPEPPPPLTGDGKKAEKAVDVSELSAKAKSGDIEAAYVLGVYYHERAPNLPEALKWYQLAADKNHAPAADGLGRIYRRGDGGVRQDYKEAFRWFQKASTLGYTHGHVHLGEMYYYGFGCSKNIEQADLLCEKALSQLRAEEDQGNPSAQFLLSWMVRVGLGVPPSKEDYIRMLRKSAEKGYPYAQAQLGYWYRNGRYVEKDLNEAIKWYQSAAEQGMANAQVQLGTLYCGDPSSNPNVDLEKAFYWFRKAAAQGDAWGYYDVGWCFAGGRGAPKDEKEAVRYYELALKTANDACRKDVTVSLGFAYEKGLGCKQDTKKAIDLYRAAAEAGSAWGQHNFGYMNETVLKNPKDAFKWYMLAAKQGLPESQTNVGNCYWHARGVKKDLDEAEKWLVMAAQHGQPQGVKYLEDLRTEKGAQPPPKKP